MAEQFFHDLFTGAHKSAEAQQAEFEKQRDEDIGMYQQTLHAPPGTVSPEQRVRAAQQIGKLRNLKKGDNPYEKVANFLNTLGDHIQKRAPGTVPTGLTGMTPMNDITPSGSNGPDPSSPKVGFGAKLLGTAAKGLGTGIQVAGNLLTGGPAQKLSSLPPLDAKTFDTPPGYVVGKKVDSYTGQDGYKYDIMQRPDGSRYEERSQNKMRGYQRPIQQGTVSLSDAKKQVAGGGKFMGEDGQPIDVSKLPPDMALLHIKQEDQSYYVPVSQKQKVVKLGGKNYGITEFGLLELPEDLASGGGTAKDFGAANPPKTTEREVPGVDAQGNPVTNQLKTVTTPGAPGVTGAPSAAPAAPSANQPPATSGKRKSLPALTPGGGAEHKQPVKGDGKDTGIKGGRPLYPTAAAWNQAQTRVVPVREAAAQLFGDPSLPNVRSLASFAKLADNPDSSQRIGQSVKLILEGISTDINKSGGLWTYMETVGGLPGLLAAAKNSQVYQSLPPGSEEQAAVDAIISSFSTAVGLRSLTKASAAQASVEKIENDIPIPGINVKNSAMYYDKLSHLAVVVANGMKSLPDYAMSPEDKKYYTDRMNDYASKAAGNQNKPKKGLTPLKSAPTTSPSPSKIVSGKELDKALQDAIRKVTAQPGAVAPRNLPQMQ